MEARLQGWLLIALLQADAAADRAPSKAIVREDPCEATTPDEIVICRRPDPESPYRYRRLEGFKGGDEPGLVFTLPGGLMIGAMPVKGGMGTGVGVGMKLGF
jgi:hypothetical protein